MRQTSQSNEQVQPNMEYGTIVSTRQNGSFEVTLPFGTVAAQKAVSCLLEPIVDDLVLLSVDMSGSCYILSVLKRRNEKEHSYLVVPGDCTLHSQSGSINIRADNTLSMSAVGNIEVTGNGISVTANTAETCIDEMSFLGKVLHTQIKNITTVAKNVQQSCKRMSQRMKSSERFVSDHEEIQTGSTRYLVEDTLTTHAGNTLNISEELHTMHAEQIHMS